MARQTHSERDHDKTLEDSFPASDPPANSGTTGAETQHKAPHNRDEVERPTGTPNSDRHAAETAHQWEHEEKPKHKREIGGSVVLRRAYLEI